VKQKRQEGDLESKEERGESYIYRYFNEQKGREMNTLEKQIMSCYE
jgi:hypothetical protein